MMEDKKKPIARDIDALIAMITDKYQLKSFKYLIEHASRDELEVMVYMIEGLKRMKYGD